MSDQPTLALLSATIDMRYLVPAFEAACPGIELRLWPELGNVAEIDAAVCWEPPPGVIATLPRLKLIQSLAAGIDHLVRDPALPASVPLCRIVDAQMASGMAAYVAWAVVQGQRHMGAYLAQQRAGEWREQPVQHPPQHRVGIAGFGTLGQACARTLLSIGYAVRGWKRSASEVAADLHGVALFHGDAQLADFLSGCDTLVCLLPLTEATRDRIDARFLAALPRGAHLINVGRGDHVVDADLLAALASGQLGAATLDAFRTEPLPAGHPFWQHPRITVTPHIATRTPIAVIAAQTLANLASAQAGRAADVAIDRRRGY
ncbi:2-hydroxyacid dehydrogenase [Aquabacterium sp. OR-4]|uniref:2-hydroxyacid dehydrogenase n=1 Tax=Aquabacterium sp. OR-4 TaxID=2978127 RepID=UPI0021B22A28|nr:glyoxylate/hydroxypyruvate reductase A [Aquabacterium sp. OR-4]MDT7838328.1 glyoxylate/hydroxypyruvate reductase A [Aquabacterium sp. OR-4]